MTGAQQAAAWGQATDRQKALANLTAATKAKMKTDTCTPAKRQQVEQDLTDNSNGLTVDVMQTLPPLS